MNIENRDTNELSGGDKNYMKYVFIGLSILVLIIVAVVIYRMSKTNKDPTTKKETEIIKQNPEPKSDIGNFPIETPVDTPKIDVPTPSVQEPIVEKPVQPSINEPTSTVVIPDPDIPKPKDNVSIEPIPVVLPKEIPETKPTLTPAPVVITPTPPISTPVIPNAIPVNPTPSNPVVVNPSNPVVVNPSNPVSPAITERQQISQIIDIDNIIRKQDQSYGSNPISQDGLSMTDLLEQYCYNVYWKSSNSHPMGIGSVIMSIVPLKKNKIGVFQISGYILQPMTDIKNPISVAYSKFFEGVQGVQIPAIVNLKPRESDVPIDHITLSSTTKQPTQNLPVPYHDHNANQVGTQYTEYSRKGSWGGAGRFDIWWDARRWTKQYDFDGPTQTTIDVRDQSNVFFFYVIIGYSQDDNLVREPDTEEDRFENDFQMFGNV